MSCCYVNMNIDLAKETTLTFLTFKKRVQNTVSFPNVMFPKFMKVECIEDKNFKVSESCESATSAIQVNLCLFCLFGKLKGARK